MSYYRRNADHKMELLAARELKKYKDGKYVFGEPCAVPIEDIIEQFYGISIEYHHLRKRLITLGQMVFGGGYVTVYDENKPGYTLIDVPPKTMLIDSRLIEQKRYANRLRFTYAHELAHYLYHKEYFSDSENSPALILGEYNVKDVIENQANMLCSYILIPTGQMKKAYYRLMMNGHSSSIISDMATIFEVSTSTMEIRLREHGMI